MVAGFGIKNPEHVKDIASVADGIVIGSEIVKRIEIDSRKRIYHLYQINKNYVEFFIKINIKLNQS